MMKSITNQIFKKVLPCLIILFYSGIVNAQGGIEESREKAFYAVSSLCYHLDEVVGNFDNSNNFYEEMIIFNDQNVNDLWALASAEQSALAQIILAQQFYYQAKESIDDPILAGELYAEAQYSLKMIWEKLNSQILEEHAVLSGRKTDLVNNSSVVYPGLSQNPFIEEGKKKAVEAFLIPLDSPLKSKLDEIFTKSRAIKDINEFKKAGFAVLYDNLYSYLVLGRHPSIPGYLQKVYLDTEQRLKGNRPGWLSLANRCQGAANVRDLIKSKKIRNFSVPDKWLYLLPLTGSPNDKQPIILIVTDMQLVSEAENAAAWKRANKQIVDELFAVISHGLGSSGLTRNVPYTKSGKFSYIDTEQPHKTPNYGKVRPYLSKEMQSYWDELVRNAGGDPKKKKK